MPTTNTNTNTESTEATQTTASGVEVVANCNYCEQSPDDCQCAECGACGSVFNLEDFCSICTNCTNGCCECWNCESCGQLRSSDDSSCESCQYCQNCCNCERCSDCGVMNPDSYCSDCCNCSDCCSCQNYVVFIPASKTPKFHNSKTFDNNKSERHIAAEIEVSSVRKKAENLADTVRNWGGAIVHDGSIDGNNPFEINTAPANGDMYLKQVNEICSNLKSLSGEANKSCGLHVHVDARDFNFYDIRKLVFLYSKIEDSLFQLVPVSRRNSRFCKPCAKEYVRDLESLSSPKANSGKIIENVYGSKVVLSDVSRDKYHDARYRALNVHSWVYRGTIECRLFEGTVNYTDIANWGMLWASILDYAYEMTEKEIRKMTGDGMQILSQIAANDDIRSWLIERKKKFAVDSEYDEDDE